MTDFPRENLIRMSPLVSVEASDDGMRTLTGVPIVFNQWTEINGWEGRFRERIAPEALSRTLAERGDKVKVLFNHGYDPQIGEKPLGKPTRMDIRDDGLYVEVPLADTSYNRDLQALIDAGALDGMSFRFGVVADEWDDDGDLPERTITELRLYELGPVTFPAYEATTVGVRSRSEYELFRERRQYLEQVLTSDDSVPGKSGFRISDGESSSGYNIHIQGSFDREMVEEQLRKALKTTAKITKSSVAPDGAEAAEAPAQSRALSNEIVAARRRIDLYLKGVTK